MASGSVYCLSTPYVCTATSTATSTQQQQVHKYACHMAVPTAVHLAGAPVPYSTPQRSKTCRQFCDRLSRCAPSHFTTHVSNTVHDCRALPPPCSHAIRCTRNRVGLMGPSRALPQATNTAASEAATTLHLSLRSPALVRLVGACRRCYIQDICAVPGQRAVYDSSSGSSAGGGGGVTVRHSAERRRCLCHCDARLRRCTHVSALVHTSAGNNCCSACGCSFLEVRVNRRKRCSRAGSDDGGGSASCGGCRCCWRRRRRRHALPRPVGAPLLVAQAQPQLVQRGPVGTRSMHQEYPTSFSWLYELLQRLYAPCKR